MFKLFYSKDSSDKSSIPSTNMNREDLMTTPYIVFASEQKIKPQKQSWSNRKILSIYNYFKKKKKHDADCN
jgi:hypothetical protein